MKKSMRAFGIGIFLTGAAIAGYDQFFPDQQTADTRALEKQIKHYEKQLKEHEHQIDELKQQVKEQETPKDVVADNEANNETTSETAKAPETEKTSESAEAPDGVVAATIYVYEDVSIYTIGQQAEDLGIVKNGRELELYLAKPEYSRSIQKGAFDLRSDMTIEEIAKTLTGKKLE